MDIWRSKFRGKKLLASDNGIGSGPSDKRSREKWSCGVDRPASILKFSWTSLTLCSHFRVAAKGADLSRVESDMASHVLNIGRSNSPLSFCSNCIITPPNAGYNVFSLTRFFALRHDSAPLGIISMFTRMLQPAVPPSSRISRGLILNLCGTGAA
jgi:hypothetical protein